MLHLTANNTTLDLDNVSIRLTRRSPIAANNGSSYVYSVSIPYTDNNAAAFGFPFRLQRRDRQRAEAPGKIWWNHRAIQEGLWKAKTTDSRTISLEMLISAGIFADSMEGKNLPELFDVPVSVPDIVAHLESQVLKTWPDVDYNFPTIYNPTFYGDPTETDPDKNPNTQFEGFLNNYKNGFVANGGLNRNTVSPQLYLGYMLTRIIGQSGYTLKGSPLADTMLKTGLIYNNVALDKLLDSSFSGEFNSSTGAPDYPILWNQDLHDPGSLYDATTGAYTARIAGDYKIKIPFTYTRDENYDFILSVEYNGTVIATKMIIKKPGVNTDFSTELDVDYTVAEADAGHTFVVKAWFTDGTSNYSVYLHPATISLINTTQPMANILRGDFNYKDLVPDMPVKTFLKDVYFGFGLLPFFNDKTKVLTLLSWNDLLTTGKRSDMLKKGLLRHTLKITANDYQGIKATFNFGGPDDFSNDGKEKENLGTVMRWLDYPSVTEGDVYYIESLNAYYQRQYNKDTELFEVNAIGDRNPATIEDDGKDQMTFNLAPMLMRCPRNINYAYRNLPAISTQGTSEAYNIRNTFPLRIMFWVGLTEPNNGTTDYYPLATTTKYDTFGNTVLPINWTTADILSRYYPHWLAWRKVREKVEFSQQLTAADMALMDFATSYFFQYAQIILEEAYIKLQNHQLGPGKITGWTV